MLQDEKMERELEGDIKLQLDIPFSDTVTVLHHDDLSQSRAIRPALSQEEDIASHTSIQSRKSIIAFSSEFSKSSFALPTVKSLSDVSTEGISTFMSACLTANYISVGYLLVPWGTILSSITFCLVMLQAYITCNYVMEACARAELYANTLSDRQQQDHPHIDILSVSCKSELSGFDTASHQPLQSSRHKEQNKALVGNEEVYCDGLQIKISSLELSNKVIQELQGVSVTECNNDRHRTSPSQSQLLTNKKEKHCLPNGECNVEYAIIQNRKFEIPELSRLFLGDTFCLIFTATACLDLYGLTWSIAAVFASSLAAEFSIWSSEEKDYLFFLGVFAIASVSLTFIPIISQVWIQIIFFSGRMVMVLVMLVTCAASYSSDSSHFGDQVGNQKVSTLADFNTLQIAFQIFIFSTANQFSVPIIASISNNKAQVNTAYKTSTVFVCLSVMLLSIVLSSFFGKSLMEKSSNLNWAVYHGGTGNFNENGDLINMAWWATLLAKYVVLYPVIDGMSNFVLCSCSLLEILLGAWYGKNTHNLKPNWKRSIIFRSMSVFPQLVGAALYQDLSAVANYTGVFTVLSYLICPCLLEIYSMKKVSKAQLCPKTWYDTPFSNAATAWTLICTGSAMILYTIIGSLVVNSEDNKIH